MRADADFMVWWHAEPIEDAPGGLPRRCCAPRSGSRLEPVWSAAALHRPAEFNKSHIPAFLADEKPEDWICVYPFVRSYEWYLLADERAPGHAARARQDGPRLPRRAGQHHRLFALGDYEWILAFEADELHRIVDLMRELRASTARRHVREELPVLHRPAVEVAELIVASLR